MPTRYLGYLTPYGTFRKYLFFFVLQYFIEIKDLKIPNFSANIQPIKYLILVLPEVALPFNHDNVFKILISKAGF